jgi:hypothetical protein
MSKMGLHDPFGHLQHKLWPKERPGSQTDNLIPEHKKTGVDQIPLRSGGMRHDVENFSTKVTTLVQTSSRLEVYTRSYSPIKLWG